MTAFCGLTSGFSLLSRCSGNCFTGAPLLSIAAPARLHRYSDNSEDERYRQRASLLVRTLPSVAEETCFALKGGTAINLFVRDGRVHVEIKVTPVLRGCVFEPEGRAV